MANEKENLNLILDFANAEEMQQVHVLYTLFIWKGHKDFPNGMTAEELLRLPLISMKDWQLLRALDSLYEKGVLFKLECSGKYRFQILPDCRISLCISGCAEKPQRSFMINQPRVSGVSVAKKPL